MSCLEKLLKIVDCSAKNARSGHTAAVRGSKKTETAVVGRRVGMDGREGPAEKHGVDANRILLNPCGPFGDWTKNWTVKPYF